MEEITVKRPRDIWEDALWSVRVDELCHVLVSLPKGTKLFDQGPGTYSFWTHANGEEIQTLRRHDVLVAAKLGYLKPRPGLLNKTIPIDFFDPTDKALHFAELRDYAPPGAHESFWTVIAHRRAERDVFLYFGATQPDVEAVTGVPERDGPTRLKVQGPCDSWKARPAMFGLTRDQIKVMGNQPLSPRPG